MCINIKNITKKLSGTGRSLLLAVLIMVTGSAYAQQSKELKGRIVDAEGNGIAGAIVNVAEQSRLALSDAEGYFSLKNVSNGDEICVTCVGYKNASAIADFEGFQVEMEEDTDEYAHEMAMPFSSKPKKFITEATSTVSGELLQKYPITVLQNAFSSTLTGVENYGRSSEPGWT